MKKIIKSEILRKHTLEGVITLNPETFYGVGTLPYIAVFTAHRPHPQDKKCKFINFIDDGYKIWKHIGLLATPNSKDRKKHLLDVWFDHKLDSNDFVVKSPVKPDDEWLHSFYYFDDTIPGNNEFACVTRDYMTFQTQMFLSGKEFLFPLSHKNYSLLETSIVQPLSTVNWGSFKLIDIFNGIKRGLKKTITFMD